MAATKVVGDIHMCAICLEAEDSPVRMMSTPCKHHFCVSCLFSWIRHSLQLCRGASSCPTCRASFDDAFVQRVSHFNNISDMHSSPAAASVAASADAVASESDDERIRRVKIDQRIFRLVSQFALSFTNKVQQRLSSVSYQYSTWEKHHEAHNPGAILFNTMYESMMDLYQTNVLRERAEQDHAGNDVRQRREQQFEEAFCSMQLERLHTQKQ